MNTRATRVLRPPRRGRGDDGQVAGIEVLPFGFLILVVGTLVVVNTWAVVQAKFAVDSAAREAVRAYVEADDAETAALAATDHASHSLAAYGHDPERATFGPAQTEAFARCARVRYAVSLEIPAISLPWVGGIGDVTVTASHSEIIDAYRGAIPDAGLCP